MPAKQKILSILDRARNAMEETYPAYEEPIYEGAPSAHYDNYSYVQHGHSSAARSARYEVPDYDAEYRRDYYREPPSYAGKHVPPNKKLKYDANNSSDYYYYYWHW